MRKLAIVGLLLLAGCKFPWESNPTGPTQVVTVINQIGNGAPSPAPSPSATAPATGTCVISETKVVMVGGLPNDQVRVGTTQFHTCTPKTKNQLGQTVDAPVSCVGAAPAEFALESDTADTTVGPHDENPFNLDATPHHAGGTYTLRCTVLGVSGKRTMTAVP